jgi:hypothetical protein
VRLKREGKQDGTPEIPGSDPYGLEGKPVKNKTLRAWRHRSIKDRKIVKLGFELVVGLGLGLRDRISCPW